MAASSLGTVWRKSTSNDSPVGPSAAGHCLAAGYNVWPPQDHKILLVDDAETELARLFDLPLRRNPSALKSRYAVAEFFAKAESEEFKKLLDRLSGKPRREFDALERAAALLAERLEMFLELEAAIRVRVLTKDDRELIARGIDRLPKLEAGSIPLLLPPHSPGERWKSLLRASLSDVAKLIKGEKRAPTFVALEELMMAHAREDEKSFASAAERYERLIGTLAADRAPLKYQAPEGWTETGVPAIAQLSLYSDTLAHGVTVAHFNRQAGDSFATIKMNYFPGATGRVEEIVNFWRIDQGLVPLAEKSVTKTLSTIQISGRKAHYVALRTPKSIPRPQERSLSAILKHGGQTWVISLHGAPAAYVDRHVADFEAHLRSLELGAPEELSAWVGAQPSSEKSDDHGDDFFLGAILRDKNRIWLVTYQGIRTHEKQREAVFQEFVESLRVRAADDPKADTDLGVQWKSPASWKRQPAEEGGLITFVIEEKETPASVDLEVLGDATEDSPTLIIDHWRRYYNLASRQLNVNGRIITVVSLSRTKADSDKR